MWEFLKDHPISILAGVIITTGSIVAGGTNHLANSEHKIAINKLETKYINDVSSLKSRLASIERKFGDQDLSYFDISRLIIPSNRIKTLDSKYIPVNNGEFFYTKPVGDTWDYANISEGQLYSIKAGAGYQSDFDKKVANALDSKNIHLWKKNEDYVFSPLTKGNIITPSATKIRFFPMVAVQSMSEEDFKSQLGNLNSVIEEEQSKDGALGDLLDSISEVTAELEQELPDTDNGLSTDQQHTPQKFVSLQQKQTDINVDQTGDQKLEIERQLAEHYRGDLTAFLLGGLIQQSIALSQTIQNVSFDLESVQKKGNVLYLQMSLRFLDVAIEGHSERQDLLVDREVFVVSNRDKLFIVQVEVPTLDGTSEAYSWVAQWLGGIRVPVKL